MFFITYCCFNNNLIMTTRQMISGIEWNAEKSRLDLLACEYLNLLKEGLATSCEGPSLAQQYIAIGSHVPAPLAKVLLIYVTDTWHTWSDISIGVPFKTNTSCVGNGEDKLAKELALTTTPGGQNSTIDLHHPQVGGISVKDMTSDDCTLGTEGCHDMTRLFRRVAAPLLSWCEKFKYTCEYANKVFTKLEGTYGSSKTSISDGIDRRELSSSNLNMLYNILDDIMDTMKQVVVNEDKDKGCCHISLKSEYIIDIFEYLKDESFKKKIDDCVRDEAIRMTLVIVHETKGWMVVKDINKINCPRITRGAPRIHVNC